MSDLEFAPSWQNRFFRAVDQAPLPSAVIFFLLFAFFVFLNHLTPWIEGRLTWGRFDPYQLNFQIWYLVVFAALAEFIHYSGRALTNFRPVMDLSDEDFRRLHYRFTHVSARQGWAITLVAAAFAIAMIPVAEPYQRMGVSLVIFLAGGGVLFSFVFFLFFFLIRNLRAISAMHSRVVHINLFHLQPLQAFSGLTSRVAIFFVIAGSLSYLTNIVFSPTPQVGAFLFFSVLNLTAAVIAFVVPLSGLHQLLQKEKERASWENDRHLESAYLQLHARAERAELTGIAEFRQVISALLEYRHEIQAVSTWPWAPGTLRSVLSAILLPLGIYLVQRLLSAALSL